MAESKAYNMTPLAATIRLTSGHGAQPRSNQVFCGGRKTGQHGEKTPRSTGEDQQTQLTYDRYLVEEKLAIQELIHWRAIFPEESFIVAKTTIQWMG